MHLVIIPQLMHPHWRKQLYKAADLVVSLPAGRLAWPVEMFEPLTLAFVFPFVSFRPWQLCGLLQLLELGRQLSRVWREDSGREGPILRQLWMFQESISAMPLELAWKVLQSQQLQSFSYCTSRKRQRNGLESKKRRRKIHHSKKRRHD
jgi:hypothetical protein